MAAHERHQHAEAGDDDRTAAAAEVTTPEESGGTARASLRAESGHITPGRRASLADAVLDLPQVQESTRLEAASRSATPSHCTASRNAAKTPAPGQPGGARSWMRIFGPAVPGARHRSQPARTPER